jgi:hypothetical protein
MVTTMKIKNELPPNYTEIVQALGTPSPHVIYCYGDTIYNPSGKEITPDFEIHEQVHSKQQGTAPELWWDKYLTDLQFRLNQEIEAYGEQYIFACKLIDEIQGGAKMKKWMLKSMAEALSGKDYGGIISYSQAETAIRKYGTR